VTRRGRDIITYNPQRYGFVLYSTNSRGPAGSIIGDKLPYDYLATPAEEDRTYALQACLIVFIVTRFTIVPRVFQLQASLAILNGRDNIITAGTGSGKTLCLLVPILLRPDSISITISPLKRLQVTQVRITGSTDP
jgi:hypothetical protein